MTQSFDVIVIGGGVVGLTAALAMSKRGFFTALVETGSLTPEPNVPNPRVYAINQASQALLQQLSIWQTLDKARISPYQHMLVWDASNQDQIEFDARMIHANALGHIVEESILKQVLLEQLQQQTNLVFFDHHQVNKIESSHHSIQVQTVTTHLPRNIENIEKTMQAKLLMIADGGQSPCRQLLQVPITTWSYHQHALVAWVNTEKSHQKTAYQVFNPDGPLAFLPFVDQNQCSIVWSTSLARANQLLALSDEAFSEELTRSFAHKLGQVTVQSARSIFPLTMRHTKQYSGAHWLLLGDAAHTIHPLAGLGLNVGLADLNAWLACLDQHHHSLTSKKALSAYHRQRKLAVWQVILMMDCLKSLFTNRLSPFIALRGIGLRLCNGFLPLKKMLIEYAAGMKE